MKITADMVVVAAKTQLSTQLSTSTGEGVVIAGLREGNYYALHAVGARVWQLVQQPAAAGEVQRIVAAEYDVSEERARSDVFALLERMAEQGLIEVARADR